MLEHFGDPAGDQNSDKSEFTSIQLQRQKYNINVRFRRSGILEGVRMIQEKLMRREDGKPGIVIDPRCTILIDGFQGGYQEDVARENMESKETPRHDNYYSHLQDALRYVMINKFNRLGKLKRDEPFIKPVEYMNPFEEKEVLTRQEEVTGYY